MFLKESITTPQNQYAAPSDSISVALQQQLSKTRAEIKQLQQAKRHNSYPKTPETSRSFRTTDGQIICRRCNRVSHFARLCRANVTSG